MPSFCVHVKPVIWGAISTDGSLIKPLYLRKKKKKKDNAITTRFSPQTCLNPIIHFLYRPPEERKESHQNNIVKAISSIRKKQNTSGNLQRASKLCSHLVTFTGFVSVDSVSDERVFAVPSCYLFVCKVGKLPFKDPASFWCPSLHRLWKGARREAGEEGALKGSTAQVTRWCFPTAPLPPPQPSLLWFTISDLSLQRFPFFSFLIW